MTSLLLTLAIAGLAALPRCVATSAADCQSLSKSLPGKVFFKSSANYEDSVSSYFFVQERASPACVVAPKTADDVSVTVKLLAKTGTKFSIRSGGHASQPGASNADNGVTIDLRAIKSVQVQSSKSVVSVGAGAIWDDVYSALDPKGLSTQGGRAAIVGVGGLTLGGGISFFSPERGFVCDSVVNFQIVLASGKIVDANAITNPDLFIALKGGSNNFGVVTRFDFKTFAQGKLWGGAITYPESTYPQLAAGFTTTKQPRNFDPYQALETSFVWLGSAQAFIGVASLYYSKPIANASSLKPITSIQPQLANSARLATTLELAREVATQSTPDLSSIWATTTFAISPDIISRIVPKFQAIAKSMQNVTTITTSMTFSSIPPAPPILSPNAIGYIPGSTPQKNLVLMLLTTFFEDASAYAKIDQLTKDLFAAVDKIANEEGVNSDYTYLNYAAKWQDPIKDYGPVQWTYLAAMSKKYDPSGVFQKQTGGFKIFK